MTHYKSLIETEYLGQWDLPSGRDVTVIISKVERFNPERRQKKKMPDGSYKDEANKRIKVSFQGKKKAWLSGPVTQATIASMYGPHLEQWIGKPISLYVDESVTMGRAKTGGIRVRPKAPTTAPTDDPLERPADPEKVRKLDAAAGRTGT